jgi:integrase/recombinase XerD
MDLSKWTKEAVTHGGKRRILLRFARDIEAEQWVKALRGSRWSRSLKAWHVEDNTYYRALFGLPAELPAEEDQDSAVNRFRKWLQSKRYSSSTIRTYTGALKVFLQHFPGRSPEELNVQDVLKFNHEHILSSGHSASYQNQFVNAIRLYFGELQGSAMDIEQIHRPRREHNLPHVLSKQEVKKILEFCGNLKHRAMLSLIYSCGLRRGELLSLKPMHIDSARGVLNIRQAKGKKDRIAPLSAKTIELLREYYKAYRPKEWLFEGQYPGQPYDERSIQLVLKKAVKKAGIAKPVTLHWLRHSYATHLLESGTDLRYIQEILGHKSSRTTEIYTHVSNRMIQNIVSPFDDL